MNRRLVGLLMASVLVLAACDEDLALAQDFIKTWALDHAGEIAKNKLGIPSGDPYVDAAVEAGGPVLALKEGDDLMAEGRKNQDPKAMDKALEKRPHDWTYEMSRANLALQQGDVGKYKSSWEGASKDYTVPPGEDLSSAVKNRPFWTQEYSELSTVHMRLNQGAGSVTGYKSYNQCVTLYGRLLALTQGPPVPGAKPEDAATWQARLADCEQISH